jgi:hypothetical protein
VPGKRVYAAQEVKKLLKRAQDAQAPTAMGGLVPLTTTTHDLDGPEHTGQLPVERLSTTETDTTLVASPDGSGGVAFRAETGGGDSVLATVAASGAAQTLDLATADVWDVTETANCTFGFSGFVAGVPASILLHLYQDGTGGWTSTFTGVSWPGPSFAPPTLDTTASKLSELIFESDDGGTTILGHLVGGGSAVSALDDLTDVTVTAPADGDVLTYDSGEWVNAAPTVPTTPRWEPVTTNPGGGPVLVWDGDDIVMTWRAY